MFDALFLAAPDSEAAIRVRRERKVETKLPFVAHYNDTQILNDDGTQFAVIKLQGIAFDTLSADELAFKKERLNTLLRGFARSNIAIYSYLIRRRDHVYPSGAYSSAFAAELNAYWAEEQRKHAALVNEYYLVIARRPVGKGAQGVIDRFRKVSHTAEMAAVENQRADIAQDIERMCARALKSLVDYQPRLLSLYQDTHGDWFSEPLGFLYYLANWRFCEVRVPRQPIKSWLFTNRPVFDNDLKTFVHLGKVADRYAAVLSTKEYHCETTRSGMLNGLLKVPHELVFCQSFLFEDSRAATTEVDRQQGRLECAGDKGQSQIDELDALMDDVTSRRTAMGWHQGIVIVHSNNPRDVGHASPGRQAGMETEARAVIDVIEAFDHANIEIVREMSSAMEIAYFAQFPGNYRRLIRKKRINTYNFAAFIAFHNYTEGRMAGSWWGSAVTTLPTEGGSRYAWNWHSFGGGMHYPPGHTIFVAPTGTGKSSKLNALIALSDKFGMVYVIFDKDDGSYAFIMANGGRYIDLVPGLSTGWNFCQLPDTPLNRAFMQSQLELMLFELSPEGRREEAEDGDLEKINRAVEGNYRHLPEDRKLANLAQYFGDPGISRLRRRFDQWLPGGKYAGAFDSDSDTLSFSGARYFGFSMTQVFATKDDRYITAIQDYIRHRIAAFQRAGTRLIITFEEAQTLLKHPDSRAQIDEYLETARKNDTIIIGITPNPAAFHLYGTDAFIRQSATKVYLANRGAKAEDYCDHYGASTAHLELLRSWSPDDHNMLITHEGKTVVAHLDFSAPSPMARFLPLLSSNSNARIAIEALMSEVGTAPQHWVPIYMERHIQQDRARLASWRKHT
ncbi:hypothetical protein [Chitinimonas sp. BJB300]|uniref:VirB4 family type IV secretion/conjugal transfer ATPase n=1 Tax=Chitinimonas sp. BJB300 TaxID=1559339 RepID=UPI00130409E4|nr:hypothetical protein [Chitinimonas sp. BJB300]